MWIRDMGCYKEFARMLFNELNHELLGPPSDGNVIILSNSDEEEAREEITVDVEAAPPSAMNSSAPSISAADADDAFDGVQDDSSDGGNKASNP
jgi:hypothetical protein